MKKVTIFLITLIGIYFYSCTCDECEIICKIDSDCLDTQYCNKNEKVCKDHPCFRSDGEPSMDCGKGECTTDFKNGTYCKCYEDSVLVQVRDFYICAPTCDGYSKECEEWSWAKRSHNSCNIEKGHCDTECQGEGSCKEGYYCSDGGACRRHID